LDDDRSSAQRGELGLERPALEQARVGLRRGVARVGAAPRDGHHRDGERGGGQQPS